MSQILHAIDKVGRLARAINNITGAAAIVGSAVIVVGVVVLVRTAKRREQQQQLARGIDPRGLDLDAPLGATIRGGP
jgi:hypothetical protein